MEGVEFQAELGQLDHDTEAAVCGAFFDAACLSVGDEQLAWIPRRLVAATRQLLFSRRIVKEVLAVLHGIAVQIYLVPACFVPPCVLIFVFILVRIPLSIPFAGRQVTPCATLHASGVRLLRWFCSARVADGESV